MAEQNGGQTGENVYDIIALSVDPPRMRKVVHALWAMVLNWTFLGDLLGGSGEPRLLTTVLVIRRADQAVLAYYDYEYESPALEQRNDLRAMAKRLSAADFADEIGIDPDGPEVD